MRKLLVALPLVLLTVSCSTFSWQGRRPEVDPDQAARGIKSAAQLQEEYESKRFWTAFEARRDGRVNAFTRDLGKIQDTLDRHFFNYSATDPFVNHPTSNSMLSSSTEWFATFFAR